MHIFLQFKVNNILFHADKCFVVKYITDTFRGYSRIVIIDDAFLVFSGWDEILQI